MIKSLLIATLLAIAAFTNAQVLDEATKLNLAVLNYALTLEHLEATFYRLGLQKFSAADAVAANFTEADYKLLGDVRDHEATHVTTLQSVLQSLGATAVSECTYDFGYGDSFTAFVGVAGALENTGVSAYDGAIALITVPALATASATIATVEARHAAYLNKLNKVNPFPAAFDTPKNFTEILAIAGPFITSCPAGNGACSGQTGASACSSNGDCLFGYCVCKMGFVGNNCESQATTQAPVTCAPVSTAAPTTAAPTTAAPTTAAPTSPSCVGANVSGPNVASPAKRQAQVCSGNGSCSGQSCVCNAGFSGVECEVAATTSAPTTSTTTAPSSGENISGDNNARADNGVAKIATVGGILAATATAAVGLF